MVSCPAAVILDGPNYPTAFKECAVRKKCGGAIAGTAQPKVSPRMTQIAAHVAGKVSTLWSAHIACLHLLQWGCPMGDKLEHVWVHKCSVNATAVACA